MDKDILKVKDIMNYLGIGRDKAYSLMKSKSFPATQIGNTYFVTNKNFTRWLEDYAGKEFVL